MVTPSIRATDAADERQLGLWVGSGRMSHRHSTGSVLAGPLLVLVAVLLVVAAVMVPGPRWLTLPLLLLPAACVLLAGALRTWAAVVRLRTGPLLMHHFDHGVVIERSHGPMRSVAFPDLRGSRLIDYPGDDGPALLLELTHRDGTVWLVTADADGPSGDFLVSLAGATEAVRERRPRYEVRELQRTVPPWTGRR